MPSTNSFAFELMKQNMAGHGSVVLAEFQSNGRGQASKSWVSDAFENLLFSVILLPVTKAELDPFSLNKTISMSLQACIQTLLPTSIVKIKWPNDILVDNRKICGILVENNYSAQKLNWSIAGIGLNVNQNFDSHPELHATSLKSASESEEISREFVLEKLLEHIEQNLTMLDEGRQEEIAAAFDRQILGFGELCYFDSHEGKFSAFIRGCDKDGRLLLETEDKNIKAYLHGSIKQQIYE